MDTRGNQKITEAAGAFDFDFRGKVVLDIGSSTGGFTEYALAAGASKVVAVEKGVNQMKAPLRFDPKVELYEKTDIFDVVSEAHRNDERVKDRAGEEIIIATPEVILADVSFVSLMAVLEYAKTWIATPETEFLVMLKPQFEARPAQLNRGVVKNERMRRDIIGRFEERLKHNGFKILQKRDNVLTGRKGNRERFYHLRVCLG